MTKQVRVENADTSDHKLVVEVWDNSFDGQPDALVQTIELNYPTAMAMPSIWKGRYLLVKEVG